MTPAPALASGLLPHRIVSDIATAPGLPRVTVARGAAAAVRSLTGSALRASLCRIVRTSAGLRAVNRLHRRLGPAARRRFYYLGYDETCLVEGPWTVEFGGRRLVLPLHRRFRMAWIAAIAFHGHDPELHHFYEAAVSGPQPPRVFFDVGASYGLHSLKLLAHGVHVVSFEPNPACHPFFIACCERNGLRPELHAAAVGARPGTVELAIPGDRTYLGTVADEVKETWCGRLDVTTRLVPQVTLDAFAEERRLVPDLVKIDVEGNELAVLEGARGLLDRVRPVVLLESWPGGRGRTALFHSLASRGYRLQPLVFPPAPRAPLTLGAFLDSPTINFVAGPGPRQ